MNQIAITGRIASDPETRNTQTGLTVYNFRFCDDYTNDFFSCTAFGQTAERMDKLQITKGTKLTLFGSIKNDEFTDKTGAKRITTKIIVNNFSFGTKKADVEAQPATQPRTQTATKQPIATEIPEEFMAMDDGLDGLPFM